MLISQICVCFEYLMDLRIGLIEEQVATLPA